MKETKANPCQEARSKFESATAFLRDRAEMSLRTEADASSVFFKLNLKATGMPFTQADVSRLQTTLVKEGFEDIRIPELTTPSPTLVCIANFSTDCETTLADLVAFVTRHQKEFPDGLATRLTVGDFAGNETHRRFELVVEDGRLAIRF